MQKCQIIHLGSKSKFGMKSFQNLKHPVFAALQLDGFKNHYVTSHNCFDIEFEMKAALKHFHDISITWHFLSSQELADQVLGFIKPYTTSRWSDRQHAKNLSFRSIIGKIYQIASGTNLRPTTVPSWAHFSILEN